MQLKAENLIFNLVYSLIGFLFLAAFDIFSIDSFDLLLPYNGDSFPNIPYIGLLEPEAEHE
jgi:hypothetical protein